jgi:hypothetical protein
MKTRRVRFWLYTIHNWIKSIQISKSMQHPPSVRKTTKTEDFSIECYLCGAKAASIWSMKYPCYCALDISPKKGVLPLCSGLETCYGAHGCPSIAEYDLVATSAVKPVFLSGATAVHRTECTVVHFLYGCLRSLSLGPVTRVKN